jgi:thymidylate synthase
VKQGRICWKINSKIPGYIDIEVEESALEKLRQSVKCDEADCIANAVNFVKNYTQKQFLEPWGLPYKDFEMPNALPTIVPGERYGHRIQGKTIAETWVKIIHRIKTTGTIRPTAYDGQWQELIDLMAIVTDEPPNFYFPEPNYLPIERDFIQQYISQISGLDDSLKLEGVKYTYAQRLRFHFGHDQIEQVIGKLIADIDSARAVMSLWDVEKDAHDSPPCLNHIWVRIVDNELSLTATFRSNDMFSAWPANAMGLLALQRHIYDAITQQSEHKLKMGPLITISQSAHIYDDCWENADNVIKSHYAKICRDRDYSDPAGSFVINVQDDSIMVEHMTPGSGEVVNCYSGKSAFSIYRQIAADCPGMLVEHAMYLGTELQKAELALSMEQYFVYDQDKSLSKRSRS